MAPRMFCLMRLPSIKQYSIRLVLVSGYIPYSYSRIVALHFYSFIVLLSVGNVLPLRLSCFFPVVVCRTAPISLSGFLPLIRLFVPTSSHCASFCRQCIIVTLVPCRTALISLSGFLPLISLFVPTYHLITSTVKLLEICV